MMGILRHTLLLPPESCAKSPNSVCYDWNRLGRQGSRAKKNRSEESKETNRTEIVHTAVIIRQDRRQGKLQPAEPCGLGKTIKLTTRSRAGTLGN